MHIQIAFFDIDGTLLSYGEPGMREAVVQSLLQLQASGVKLFLATGRPPFFLPDFGRVRFDGVMCYNGGYCYAGDEIIHADAISPEDARIIRDNAARIGLPIALSTADRHGSNGIEQNLADYFMISGKECVVVDDFEQLMTEDIYQIMVGASASQDVILLEGTKAVKAARWWDRAVDIIPADSGKAAAIEKILTHYGIDRMACAAFGDGGNDLDMIEYAGIGIAMGNAKEDVKAAADYVTDTCERDGVARAIEALKLA